MDVVRYADTARPLKPERPVCFVGIRRLDANLGLLAKGKSAWPLAAGDVDWETCTGQINGDGFSVSLGPVGITAMEGQPTL
jgi:hypothetical protein